jgi:membrane-associated HD superfamily phosphohydrolase
MDMSTLNIWAVLVAAVSAFVLGALWYSKIMFGNAWMTAAGLTEEETQDANMGKIFGLAFIMELIMAFNLGMFLNDPSIDTQAGALYGFLTGFGWIAMGIGVVSLFEQRSWKYILINGGYMTVSLLIMGLILGAWK